MRSPLAEFLLGSESARASCARYSTLSSDRRLATHLIQLVTKVVQSVDMLLILPN
jgi:hypothetical protein